MAPSALLYALSDARWDAVSTLCRTQGVTPRRLEGGDYATPIGALLGFPGAAAGAGGPILDEMMVLCGFTAQRLDDFLAAFRAQGVAPIALKAVLTPSNAAWSGAALYRELLRERQGMG